MIIKRSAYLNTRKGQLNSYRTRSYEKFHFSYTGLLKTKGSNTKADDINFQKKLITEMAQLNRRAFRKEVVIEMHFTISQNNPPQIQKLPKYYIDLLENTLPELQTESAKLLHNKKKTLLLNDRQIKLLTVSYYVDDHKTDAVSSMRLTIYPFRNFLEDLILLDKIFDDDFEDDERKSHRYGHKEINRYESYPQDEDYYDQRIDSYFETISDKERLLKIYPLETYNFFLDSSRRMAQEAYLKRKAVDANQLLTMFSNVLLKNKPAYIQEISKILDSQKNLYLSRHFSIELPGTPTKKGEGEAFFLKTEKALADFYNQHHILNPVVVPLSIVLFLIPPKNSGKDLDNLGLSVIPLIHKILSPPTWEGLAFKIKKENPESFLKSSSFKGIHRYMISSYQIIELPRGESDSDSGSVHLFFENGINPFENVITKSYDLIDKWKKELEDY